ncbi:MAG: hypothetical protein ACYCXB_10205, partial [Candidatus Humimicrobiaceae bacterium]
KIRLTVDKSVLIPRPETELLVEKAKKAILQLSDLKNLTEKPDEPGRNNANNVADAAKISQKGSEKIQNEDDANSVNNDSKNIKRMAASSNQVINILEIGTGSGAVAISLLYETEPDSGKAFPVEVVATDISGDALKTAVKNADRILSQEKNGHLKIFECDVIPQDNEVFLKKYLKNIDLVISNPPYISEANYKNLERQIKEFEPEQALNAGKTGTEKYIHILKIIKPFLNPKVSCIIFETDPLTSNDLQKIIKAEFKESSISIEKDYNDMDRILAVFIGN